MTMSSHRARLSGLEGGIAVFLLTVTFRINVLPSLLAKEVGATAVWVIALSLVVDTAVSVACYYVARLGGVSRLSLPDPLKRIVSALVAVLCLFKAALYVYEAGSFATGLLFDTGNFWVLSIGFAVVAGVLAAKGARGIARTSIIFCLMGAILAVLTVFFVGQEGEGYNLFALLRPAGLGKGLLAQGLWMGDGLVLLFVDLSDASPKARRWLPVGWTLGAVAVLTFFVMFFYTFGPAGEYIDHAFARTLMKESPHELGAVDWPVILMWLNAVPLVVAYHLNAAAAGLEITVGKGRHQLWATIATASSIGIFAGMFGNKQGTEYASFWGVSVAVFAIVVLGVIFAISGVLHAKSKKKVVA